MLIPSDKLERGICFLGTRTKSRFSGLWTPVDSTGVLKPDLVVPA